MRTISESIDKDKVHLLVGLELRLGKALACGAYDTEETTRNCAEDVINDIDLYLTTGNEGAFRELEKDLDAFQDMAAYNFFTYVTGLYTSMLSQDRVTEEE